MGTFLIIHSGSALSSVLAYSLEKERIFLRTIILLWRSNVGSLACLDRDKLNDQVGSGITVCSRFSRMHA